MAKLTYSVDHSLTELRTRLIWLLGYVLIGFGILGAWYVVLRKDIPLMMAGLLCLVIFLGRVIQIVVTKHPNTACYMLMWGCIALLADGMSLFVDPWLPYLGVVCVFVSAILSITAGGLPPPA